MGERAVCRSHGLTHPELTIHSMSSRPVNRWLGLILICTCDTIVKCVSYLDYLARVFVLQR